jgi:PAS domain S-box-containing protein
MNKKPNPSVTPAELRHRAETRLRKQPKPQPSKAGNTKSVTDTRRLLHELQVHQVELEMQNTELQEGRDRMEALLEKYTDLYDFAPVGYFSLDDQGLILEVNLTGAAMLGVERSRLVNQRLPRYVVPESQSVFRTFLQRVFAETDQQFCEAALLKPDAVAFWASLHGVSALAINGPRKWCRVAVSDITSLKKAEEAQRRMETLAVANRELSREILRRQAGEEALRESEQHSRQLLEQSRHMQEQLRLLSRQLLSAQEEERKKISRELHDVIAQTLTSINLRLAALKANATVNTKDLERNITRTQQMVEHSVSVIHRFARELRPAVLDDLGLIPALHAFMKNFKADTGIHVSLSAFAAVEQMKGDKRTVLYRVAQEALTNVARHAQASHAEVSIQKRGDAVCMIIKDNGKGFHQQHLGHAIKSKRLGLLGMRERLDMVGGSFNLESKVGEGTTILVQIPADDGRSSGG